MILGFTSLRLPNDSGPLALGRWISRNLGLPLALLATVFASVLFVSAVEVVRRNEENRQRFFNSVAAISDLAARKQDVALIESVLVLGMRQSEAKWAAVCKAGSPLIQYPALYAGCDPALGLQEELLRFPLSGSAGVDLVFAVPRAWASWDVLRGPVFLLIFTFFSSALIWFSSRRLKKNLVLPLQSGLLESGDLRIRELIDLQADLVRAVRAERERAAQEAEARVVHQVAHDIRSPLAALGLLEQNLTGVPEDVRDLARSAIGRIREIASDLVGRGKAQVAQPHEPGEASSGARGNRRMPLALVAQEVFQEKKYINRGAGALNFRFDVVGGHWGTFVEPPSAELARLLSNLIGNAIEASAGNGTISVVVGKPVADGAGFLGLEVSDTGIGMGPEVLARLGERGFSVGKESHESGSGLGVWHAKKIAESAGGRLSFDSNPGKGTRASLVFPIAPAPQWFCDALPASLVEWTVAVDDDPSVLGAWEARWSSLVGSSPNSKLVCFSNPGEFLGALDEKRFGESSMFLIDHDFPGTGVTGVMMIEEYQLSRRAILVTSRAFEPEIQEDVRRLGARLLPKALIPWVTVS